jgi:hypothetical protein
VLAARTRDTVAGIAGASLRLHEEAARFSQDAERVAVEVRGQIGRAGRSARVS